MPTKVLTDPQGLNQALQSGIQAVNGFAFDAASAAAAAAAAAAANGVAYPEAYQVTHHNNLICWSTDFIYVSLFFSPADNHGCPAGGDARFGVSGFSSTGIGGGRGTAGSTAT